MATNSDQTKKMLRALGAKQNKDKNMEQQENHDLDQSQRIEKEVYALLHQIGLETNPKIVKAIADNFKYKNRLIDLFKTLKNCNITLADPLVELIAIHASKAGSITRLLEFIKTKEIDPKYIHLEDLLTTSFSEENLIWGFELLNDKGYLTPIPIKLMFTYLEHSLELAKLIINMQEHASIIDPMSSKFEQFSKKCIGSIIDLLNFTVENDLFYPGLLDILLRQEQFADTIYEGAKKLATEKALSASYFEIIENNPKNATIIAKNILLLFRNSLIDYQNKGDLLVVSQFGLGILFFLEHLKNADMLNSATYTIIRQKNPILYKEEVIDIFRKIPLFETISKEELTQLLHLINKSDYSNSDCDSFIDIISTHKKEANSSLTP